MLHPMLCGGLAGIIGALLLSGCGWGGDLHPAFGFRVVFVREPDPEGNLRCGFEDRPLDWTWRAGPHEGFEVLNPAELARESREWLETSDEVAVHRRDRDVRLELVYPSGELVVTAARVPDSELGWEPQLRAWFECFPPADPAGESGEGEFDWDIWFGPFGGVGGEARTEPEALDEMRSLAAEHPPGSPLAPSLFRMSTAVQRASHEWDVYTAEVDALTRLDELPAILHEQRREVESRR